MATYAGKLNVGGTELPIGSTLYGTCSTAAGTAQKDVTCANFDKLITGVTIHVKFTNSNTHATPTLKVNSTTAAQIMRYGTTKPGTSEAASWMAGSVVSFTYDGTYWQMNGWINSTYTIPSAATANPVMDGTAAVGSSAKYAKEDHVHPSDTSRVPTSRTVNSKALTSDITLSASDVSAIASSAKGAANGVAELDANGLVPTSQLPSFVDDVLEYTNKASFPTTGETGKIYVDLATNLTYRWSGSAYVEISPSLALGTTSSTAFRGDYGNSAYAHAVTNKGSAFTSGLYKITTNSEGHVTAATAVAKADITGLGIPGSDTWNAMTGATSSANGTVGYVNAVPPKDGYNTKYLRADGTWSVPPDNNTTYGLSISDHTVSLVAGGTTSSVTVPDNNDNNAVTQTATTTSADYEVLFSSTADNTTRTEGARKNSNLKFNPSTGNLQTTQINGVAVGSSPKFTDNNTTYTFANGTNGFTVTPSGGSAQTVTVTPSITNNVTGSGTSGYIAKFNGANTITSGPQLGSSTTTFLRNDGSWATPTDNNTTYTFANGTNGFTVTPSGGSAQTVTVTPSITNNVTGSGTSGYLTKFNGANTITNGPQLGSSTATYLRNDGSWASPDDRYPYYGGRGTEISENANLNTYTTPGTYYSPNSTRSGTLTNTPVTGSGFKLYVEAGYQGARKYQMIKYAGSPDTFTRMTDDSGSTWGPWQSTLGHKIYAVKGTQTASTNAWTGNIDAPALYDGLTIAYYLPYAGNSSSATLNLTLSTGSTTGAKNVYYTSTTRATTHYGVGSTIMLTYWSKGSISVSGTATTDDRWTSFDYNTNSNTYDREYFNGAVKAETAITAGYLTCGTAAGYKNIAKGTSFDISYPVMYQGTAIAAGSTRTDFYHSIPINCTATNGGTSPAFTLYKAVYLYGTLSGSTFTIDSSTIFTQTVPSSEDGKAYYYLGQAYSATNIKLVYEHKVFEYKGGSFHEVTNTDGIDASITALSSADSVLTARINNEVNARTAADTNLQTQITTESNTRASVDSQLSTRIDSFTSLSSGSTTGDAELIDGRVGFDGQQNNNIGGAIRTQISDLQSSVDYGKCILSHNILRDSESVIGTKVSNFNNTKFYIGCGKRLNGFGKNNITLKIEFTGGASVVGVQYYWVYAGGTVGTTAYNLNTMYGITNISNYSTIVGIKLVTYSTANTQNVTNFGLVFNAEAIDQYQEYEYSRYLGKFNNEITNKLEEVSFTYKSGVRGLSNEDNTGDATFQQALIPVKPYETYVVTGYSFPSTDYPAWIFVNYDYPVGYPNQYIVSHGEGGLGFMKTEKVVVPEDARYLIVNTMTSVGPITIHRCVTDVGDSGVSNTALNYWAGKKIAWFGTSIPAGMIQGKSYPQIVGGMLGAKVYNESIGSSEVRAGVHAAITANDPMGWADISAPGLMLSLSMSQAEKQDVINNWDSKWKNIITWYQDQLDLTNQTQRYLNSSWDVIFPKYLSGGSIGQCDLYVFDHGFNDGARNSGFTDLSDIPTNQTDRTYWIGAMGFLFRKILDDNPKARILILGFYSYDKSAGTNFDTKHVCDAQEKLAKIWGFPFIKVWEHIGWSHQIVSNNGVDTPIANVWMPDDLHPSSDPSGDAIRHYAEVLYPLIRDVR